MPQPTTYVRNYDFTSFQEQYPDQSLPATPLDANLDAIGISIGQIVNRIALIQRDDGALKNQIVTIDSLSPAVVASLGSPLNPLGEWETDYNYERLDLVTVGVNTYICSVAHTSAVFDDDLDAGYWVLFSNPQVDSGAAFFQKISGDGVADTFVLTDDVGTDANAVMVFYDAGGDDGYQILDTTLYTVDGTSIVFDFTPVSGTGNIYVFAPYLLLGTVSSAATNAQEAAVQAQAYAVSAFNSAQAAEASAESLFGTSISSVTVGLGSKSFTTDPNRIFIPGTWLIAVEGGGTAYVHGQVTAYDSGTGALTLNVTNTSGAGTFAAWVIIISGTQGPPGDASALEATAITYDNVSSGLTATDVQSAIDEIAAGAASFTVNAQTAVTDIATEDFFAIADASNSNGNRKVSPETAFKTINILTELTTPDLAADFLSIFDTSAGLPKKILPENLLGSLAGGIIDVQFFTASGTWTKPSGCNSALVFVTGGGGGGAGAISSRSYGGSTGGTSSFGSHCSATGGSGGPGSTSNANIGSAQGGVGSSGNFNIRGGGGCAQQYGRNGSEGTFFGIVTPTGGPGGSSFWGGGGQGTDGTGINAGGVGSFGGGGAAGAYGSQSSGETNRGCASGAAGGTAVKWIPSGLSATEAVTVGAGGVASTTPASASRGGVGGTGCVMVISFK
jgi:hypothetical protein